MLTCPDKAHSLRAKAVGMHCFTTRFERIALKVVKLGVLTFALKARCSPVCVNVLWVLNTVFSEQMPPCLLLSEL